MATEAIKRDSLKNIVTYVWDIVIISTIFLVSTILYLIH